MPDINAKMTPEMMTLGIEAKRIIESEAMVMVFVTLRESYIAAWEASEADEAGQRLRGTLWVKMQCLKDLQTELKSYAERAEFAEMAGQS